MKRALRRHQKDVKFTKRLKMAASEHGSWLIKDEKTNKKKWVKNLTWKDLKDVDCSYIHQLKTMSTTCSCSMCSYYKYDRTAQKKENKKFLNFGFEE
jgi:hypothetical protein